MTWFSIHFSGGEYVFHSAKGLISRISFLGPGIETPAAKDNTASVDSEKEKDYDALDRQREQDDFRGYRGKAKEFLMPGRYGSGAMSSLTAPEAASKGSSFQGRRYWTTSTWY